jgi:hypothetical protein
MLGTESIDYWNWLSNYTCGGTTATIDGVSIPYLAVKHRAFGAAKSFENHYQI